MTRTYIEWLSELPWSKSTKDNLDLKAAARILDEDHYDLEKVKERILEYPGRQETEEVDEGADPLLRGAAGRRQDVAREVHRAGHGPAVRPDIPGRAARRGGDPRSPPHLRGRVCRGGSSRE